MALGFFESTNDPANPDTYDSVARKRKLIDALLAKGTDTSPVQHWSQGLARIVDAAGTSYQDAKLTEKEKEGSAASQKLLMALSGLSDAPAISAPSGGALPSAASAGAATPVPPGALTDAIQSAAAKTGVDPAYLARTAQLESSYGKNLQSPLSSAGGPFAFTNGTARQYGLTDKNDPNASADAAARLALDNKQALARAIGRDPSNPELYLAHQQGAGGASALLSNPQANVVDALTPIYGGNRAAALQAVRNNGGSPDMTAGQFAGKWTSKFGGGAQMPGATPDSAALGQGGAASQSIAQAAPIQVASNAPGLGYAPAGPSPAQPSPVQGGPSVPLGSPEEQAFTQIEGQAAPGAVPAGGAPMPPQMGGADRGKALIAAALADPRLSPQQKQMALQMYTLTQKDDKPMVLNEGASLVKPNGRGGYDVIAGGSAKQTNEQRNYEAARAGGFQGSFTDYMTQMKKAGATNVSIDQKTEGAFDQKIAGKQADLFSSVEEDGRSAKSDVANIQALRGQIGKLPGGFMGGAVNIANSYGLKLGPNASNVEAANALISKLVPAQRQGMPGAASDRDVQMFKDSLPKLSNTPQGNKIILDTMESLAQYKMAAGQIAAQVMTGQMNRNDGMKALQALPDPMSMFKAAQSGGQAAPAPSANPGGFSPDEVDAELRRRGLK